MTGLKTFNYVEFSHGSTLKNKGTYLELSIRPSNRNSSLVSNYLSCDHSHSLALRRVDLARHDAATRFVFRQTEFAQTASRPRAKVTNVVGDLHQRNGKDIQCTVSFN